MVNFELLRMTATELTQAYKKKALSPVEVVENTLSWIRRHNPKINAFTVWDEDRAMMVAKESEKRWLQGRERGILEGIPITAKDCFHVKGWKTTFGSKLNANTAPSEINSIAIEDICLAGANVIGKTTMPESFWKVSNESPLTGITRNPWNLKYSPGGSSGGSAAATAAGMGYIGLSTDGAGSIRVPASFCGLVGIKPTHGLIPISPPIKFGDFACYGSIARSVADGIMLLDTIRHKTTKDPLTLSSAQQCFKPSLDEQTKQIRIAFTTDMYSPYPTDPEVLSLFNNVIQELDSAFPQFTFYEASPVASAEEAITAMETIKILRFTVLYSLFKDLDSDKKKLVDEELLCTASLGAHYSAMDYVNAEHQRRLLNVKFCEFFDDYDILIMPTVHETAFPVETPAYPPNAISLPYSTMLFNMSLQPALTLPVALTKNGLPVGIQLVSQRYDDMRLLQVAQWIEKFVCFPYFNFLSNNIAPFPGVRCEKEHCI